MQLIQFGEKVGRASISARDLDDNFARLRPLQNDGSQRQYAVEETPQGWRLIIDTKTLLPSSPTTDGNDVYLFASSNNELFWINKDALLPTKPTTGRFFLSTNNGVLEWDTASNLFQNITAGSISGGAISPGENTAVFVSQDNQALWTSAASNGALFMAISGAAQWSEPPPSGTPAWRAVERCDGKTMYVWATEWED